MSYMEGFHRILSLPTPIEGARHRPQGVAVHLLENFPVYKMPFLSSLQISKAISYHHMKLTQNQNTQSEKRKNQY